MNWFFGLPLEMTLGLWFLVGLMLGGQVNRGIYRLAWDSRHIGPWTPPLPQAPPRHWSDKLPIVGWLGLQRETGLHGRGYWIRPILIEICCGVGLAALYFWEMDGRLVPGAVRPPNITLFVQFLSHATLLMFLVVATFIDFDEKTIPDGITIPGTLIGLLFAAKLPASLLPISAVNHLLLTAPLNWPNHLNGRKGLLIGIACFLAWCFALLPKTWWTRHGWLKALRYLWASMIREHASRPIIMMAIVGTAVIAMVWGMGAPLRWASLLTQLIGVAFGGGLIWAVRVVAGRALGKEAMGFGDVTLMAMIGAYLGWQSTLIVFFIAPIAGSVIAVIQKLTTREPEIAFGPFLSLGALVLIVCWKPIWQQWGAPIFPLGWLIPLLVAACLALMGIMLGCWRRLTELVKR